MVNSVSYQNQNRATSFPQPAATVQGPSLAALNWKPFLKNTLKGFVDLELIDFGIILRSVCYHEKSDSRWISPPAKPWTDKEGNQQWAPLMEFSSGDYKAAFQAAAIKAIDELRGGK